MGDAGNVDLENEEHRSETGATMTSATGGGHRRWTPRSVAVQVVGIILSAALLVWALVLMLSPGNRENLQRIFEAPPSVIAGLLGLSAASVVVNGLIFWWVARPIKRMNPVYLIGVNSIATFLSVLPFKLNLATRVLIHHRRDGMSFAEIIAWMAGMSGLALVVMVPAFVAGAWRGELDAWWFVVVIGGITLGGMSAVVCGRIASREDSTAGKWLARLSLGCWRVVREPGVVVGSVVMRLVDVGVLAGRFLVAAAIIGHALPWETAVVFGAAYFILSVVTPSGSIGVREGGVIGLGSLAGHDLEALATVTVIVSAAELVTAGVMALGAMAIIRPDRLFGKRRRRANVGEIG